MGFQANLDVMRTEAAKWQTASTDLSGVHTRFDGNDSASGAFSIIGLALGTAHDDMAEKLTLWSGEGTTRFTEIGNILTWISNNYTGTDADQTRRYEG